MYFCPRCHQGLAQKGETSGLFWRCDRCGGSAVGFAVMRRHVGEMYMAGIWQQLFQVHNKDGGACPTCTRAMTKAAIEVAGRAMKLDFCRICEFAWFEAGEFEALPLMPLKPRVLTEADYPLLPTELRERLARLNVNDLTESARGEELSSDKIWNTISSAPGLPARMETDRSDCVPWATHFLSVVMAGISIATFFHSQVIIDLYGLIPDQFWRDDGLTWLTSFFLHGSWFQLLGNLYFLLLFGRAVETALGPWRLLLIVLVADQTGNLLEVLGAFGCSIPCIGASGGISGIVAYYALAFPRVRLSVLLSYGYAYWRWIQFPAWAASLIWIGLQTLSATEQVTGFSSGLVLANLGGAGAGVFFWLKWRRRTNSRGWGNAAIGDVAARRK